ncbi:hypothetical protein [Streptomyces avermitilis]|uniref:hypothetical protein n=1 Tax=Streptomyces avermitilis TaxID=33903 RepID=UPI0036C5B59B
MPEIGTPDDFLAGRRVCDGQGDHQRLVQQDAGVQVVVVLREAGRCGAHVDREADDARRSPPALEVKPAPIRRTGISAAQDKATKEPDSQGAHRGVE